MSDMNFGVNLLPVAPAAQSLGNSSYPWQAYFSTLNNMGIPDKGLATSMRLIGVTDTEQDIEDGLDITGFPIFSFDDNNIVLGYRPSIGDVIITSPNVFTEESISIYDTKLFVWLEEGWREMVTNATLADSTYTLPSVTSTDNGKALMVSGGEWVVNDIPIVEIPMASDTSDGVMSKEDKIKLDAFSDATDYALKTDTVLNSTLSRGRAEGSTVGSMSLVFGYNLTASASASAALGSSNTSSGSNSFTIGAANTASAVNSFAGGYSSVATQGQGFAFGYSASATGSNSTAFGNGTVANKVNQFVFGKYNIAETGVVNASGTYAEIVGNGTESTPSNARTLDWSGNETLAGTLTLGSPLTVGNGGTGLTTAPSLLINLASTSAASVFQASPRPGVTGTLKLGNGGTGATTAKEARTNLETLACRYVTVGSNNTFNIGTYSVAPANGDRVIAKFTANSASSTTIKYSGTIASTTITNAVVKNNGANLTASFKANAILEMIWNVSGTTYTLHLVNCSLPVS